MSTAKPPAEAAAAAVEVGEAKAKVAPREHSGRRQGMQMPDSIGEEMRAVAAQAEAEEQARRSLDERRSTGGAVSANSRWRKAGLTVMAAGRFLGIRGAC